MAIQPDDTETVAISDMTYAMIQDMGTLVKEGPMMKRPSRQGGMALGRTKQRFIVLHTDRLMWFKKGEATDCLLGEIPITAQTELIKYPASVLGPEKLTVKTGSKELDLMPIQLSDVTEWERILQVQVELNQKGPSPAAAGARLCQCAQLDEVSRVLSGAMYMAGKALGLVKEPRAAA